MNEKKQNNILFFIGSVLLIIVAIAVSAILQKNTTSQEKSSDVRARAGVASSLELTGVLSSIDDISNVFILDNVKFPGSDTQSLGTWTVSPPPKFSLSSLSAGKTVRIKVNAATFLATSHTVTATEVKTE